MKDISETPSIAQLQTGEKARLLDNHFGRGDTSRMASFGLTPGVTITVVQNYGRGPMIVRVRGSHIALGRMQAKNLHVQRMSE